MGAHAFHASLTSVRVLVLVLHAIILAQQAGLLLYYNIPKTCSM